MVTVCILDIVSVVRGHGAKTRCTPLYGSHGRLCVLGSCEHLMP